MRAIFLLYYSIVHATYIHTSNNYLGCFRDQIGNRDLSVFVDDSDQLTPEQCISACRKQTFSYAGIQYGNECRCGQQYGRYGRVSEDECDYLCLTAEKCGGDNRNSVYSVDFHPTCYNHLNGYQGCFGSGTLTIDKRKVNSIEECIEHCDGNYVYAGVMDGHSCYCGNDLNHPSLNSDLCYIQCEKSFNDTTVTCCGGRRGLSVYHVEDYQSSLIQDRSEILNRAATDSTHISSLGTAVSSPSTVVTASVTSVTSQTLSNTNSYSSSPPSSPSIFTSIILSSISHGITNSPSTLTNQPVGSTSSHINDASTSVLSSSGMSSGTSMPSTNTPGASITTPTSTLAAMSTGPTTFHPTSISQVSTNPVVTTANSFGSSSIYSVTFTAGISSTIHTNPSDTTGSSTSMNSASSVSTASATLTNPSSLHSDTSSVTSVSASTTMNAITSQTSSHTDTSPVSRMSTGTSMSVISAASTYHTDTSPVTSINTGTFVTVTSTAPTSHIDTSPVTSINTGTLMTGISTASVSHTNTSPVTNTGSSSSWQTTGSQMSSRLDTFTSTNPTNSISFSSSLSSNTLSTTVLSLHTDTTQTVTSSHTTEFSYSSNSYSTGSPSSQTSPYSSMMTSTTVTHISQTSPVSISANSITANSVAANTATSFSSLPNTQSQSASSLISTLSSYPTPTVSQHSSTMSLISNTSPLSTSTYANSSATVATLATISSSSLTGTATQTTTTSTTTYTSSNTATSTSSSSTVTSSSTSLTVTNTNTVTSTSSNATTSSTTVPSSDVISTVIIIPSGTSFDPSSNTTRASIRQGLINVVNLAFFCFANPSSSNCTQGRRLKKRQTCSSGYDVNLLSNLTDVSTSTLTRYLVNYAVLDLCNSGAFVTPAQLGIVTNALTSAQISRILGYQVDGAFVRGTSSASVTPTADPKLWLIGAVLGPVVFVLLLICVCCYLHYKCRPRNTNRALTKTIYNQPIAPTRSTDYETVNNATTLERATTEKTVQVLAQNDPMVGRDAPPRRLAPIESERIVKPTPSHQISNEVPLEEIRRQNDVERWRNKLRLQEKFQHPFTGGYSDSSVPNTNRSQYDNRTFEHDVPRNDIQPVNEMPSSPKPRPLPQIHDIESGRTKLHRLLDEVLDKADDDQEYNPDTDIERQKRRRQRRQMHPISEEHRTQPFDSHEQTPHIPVIPQVSERPDPSLLRLRYNPYEAGDRVRDISRQTPVRLQPKNAADDQQTPQYPPRSNPPLFFDDSIIPDRAATAIQSYADPKRVAKTRLETDREAEMRHSGGRLDQRQHKFDDDIVYIEPIGSHRVQARTAWAEPEENHAALHRNDYRDEYMMAKRSVMNTKNIINSIHDELQHIAFPVPEDYHA